MRIFLMNIFLCTLLKTNAQQNLVPNPSFENYTVSPCGLAFSLISTVNYVPPWRALLRSSDTLCTVDFFNGDSCDYMVPYNLFGYQLPFTGDSYIGFIPYQTAILGPDHFGIESFYVTLDSILSSENNYELCMHLSLPEQHCINTRRLSFSITEDTLTMAELSSLSHSDIFYLEGLELCNYSDWTQICTTFSPAQTGSILTFNVINNREALISDTALYDYWECEPPIEIISTYYYIDNVSLVNKGKNTGVKDFSKIDLNVFPNPTNDLITLSFGKQVKGNITLNNLMGQLLITQAVNNEIATFDLCEFSTGIYFVKFTNEHGHVATEKIVVE